MLYGSYHLFFTIVIVTMIITMIGAMLYCHYDYQKTLLFITIATTITITTTISIVVTMMVSLYNYIKADLNFNVAFLLWEFLWLHPEW